MFVVECCSNSGAPKPARKAVDGFWQLWGPCGCILLLETILCARVCFVLRLLGLVVFV